MTPQEKIKLIEAKFSIAKIIMNELHAEYGVTFMVKQKDGIHEGELGMLIPLDRLEENT